jgi:hypothetical protein
VTEVKSVRSTEYNVAAADANFMGRDIAVNTANHRISVEEHMQRLYEEGIKNSVVWGEEEDGQDTTEKV